MHGKSDLKPESGHDVPHGQQTELICVNTNTYGSGGIGSSGKAAATLMKDRSLVAVPIKYSSGRVIFEINIDNFMRVAHQMEVEKKYAYYRQNILRIYVRIRAKDGKPENLSMES